MRRGMRILRTPREYNGVLGSPPDLPPLPASRDFTASYSVKASWSTSADSSMKRGQNTVHDGYVRQKGCNNFPSKLQKLLTTHRVFINRVVTRNRKNATPVTHHDVLTLIHDFE